jgi:hypothetical protein
LQTWQAVKYFCLGFGDYIADNDLRDSQASPTAYHRGRQLALYMTGGF